MTKLKPIHYLKHYIGQDCNVLDPQNIMSGVIEKVDIEDDSVQVDDSGISKWVDAKFVKPDYKTFSDLDQDDLNVLIDNMVVNSILQKSEDFIVNQRTENFILLHSEKFNISIKRNWGILCLGVNGSIACPVDNTGTLIFLLCEMNYDVAGVFQ